MHYSKIIKKYGLLNLVSSIRFEAKHKQLKSYAKATLRLNPSYTFAFKQLELCRFVYADGFSDHFQHDTKIFKFSEVFDYYNIKNVLHPEIMYDNLQLDCIS